MPTTPPASTTATTRRPSRSSRVPWSRAAVIALAAAHLPLAATGQDIVEVGPGVFAVLTANDRGDSNKGFVVGNAGVLLVDGSAAETAQLVAAVRSVTNKPILYAVGLNHHADHAGGVEELPEGVTFVAHVATVQELARNDRAPPSATLTFERDLRFDLGDRVVEVRHFGAGNTLGDAVVYVPDARVAYTGNLIYGHGSIPWLSAYSADAEQYLRTIARLTAGIDATVVVPGHGPITDHSVLVDYAAYLAKLIAHTKEWAASGVSVSDALAAFPYDRSAKLDAARPFFADLMAGIHRGNVELTLEAASARAVPDRVAPVTTRSDSYEIKRLAPRVYALLPLESLTTGTGLSAVPNGGFVVGDAGVLVVDAGTNAMVAAAIQRAVSTVTDQPIRYVVNTSDHGDHTFGNASFPGATVIAHSANAARMREDGYRERETAVLVDVVGIVRSREAVADVAVRPPDLGFDGSVSVDLGGIDVELLHFGPAHTAGDVLVHVPDAGVVWGGNLIFGANSIPFLFEGRPREYVEAIAAVGETVRIEHVVTGHLSIAAPTIVSRYLDYLTNLIVDVRAAIRSGHDEETALAALPMPDRFAGEQRSFWTFLHRINVRTTHQDLRTGN